jgi:transposase-like protein
MKKTVCCPFCNPRNNTPSNKVIRKGWFKRACDGIRVQRYQCNDCNKGFSDQTLQDTYRMHSRKEIRQVELLLTSGVSQRRCALLTGKSKSSIQKILHILSDRALQYQKDLLFSLEKIGDIQFDDLETFEHTKLKPLSVALAVDSKRRLILDARVNRMPAKGLLAQKSKEKYGRRRDERYKGWNDVLRSAKVVTSSTLDILTDSNPHYPKYISAHFPLASHRTVPGGRGCIAGYGELKRKGFDPMFSLNHTCAMFRDNLACLKRRTWTTTKKPEELQCRINVYLRNHNERILKQLAKKK